MKPIEFYEKELSIVHRCLTEFYEYKFNDELNRVARIKKALKEIEVLYDSVKTPKQLHAMFQKIISNLQDLRSKHNDYEEKCQKHITEAGEKIWQYRLVQNERTHYQDGNFAVQLCIVNNIPKDYWEGQNK